MENTRRRADQSGRTVKSSLNTGFSIYWVVGGGDEWVTSCWEFLVREFRVCFMSAAGCHEKRGVRINMTNRRVWNVLFCWLSLSLSFFLSLFLWERVELVGKRREK